MDEFWVNAKSAIVHHKTCDYASAYGYPWTPEEMQPGDRACRKCLSEGLPT